jgi:hypothetical protein
VAWLVAFRVLFGLAMSVSALRFLAYGWIADFWIKPRFHFKYWGFGWIPELPPWGMIALFVVLAALGLAIAAGAFFRLSAILFFLAFAYVQLIDVSTYLNHYYLASILAALLAISPAHRAYSFDAWRAKTSITHVPAVWLTLFRFQIAVVYTFAGLAKMNADWLIHGMPLRIWLASKTDMPILGAALFSQEWAAPVMSWAGFLFDTSIPWFLMWRRTRLPAYGVVIVFHVLTRLLFPIGMFPVIMVMSALVFFPPDWPTRLLRRKTAEPRLPEPASPRARRFALAAMAVFCVAQVLLPLRFLVYGGDVRWHEQGMRFSWRVMVREKNGSVTFVVREKNSGKTSHVAPRAYLTALQEREMSGQPDLILQLAHRIRDDYERRVGPVEVRVQADASLNGRRVAPMIDPEVDLARVDDGLAKAAWILPVPPEDPPHLRPAPSHVIGRN